MRSAASPAGRTAKPASTVAGRVRRVALALCLVLAGCSVGPVGPIGSDAPAETATPAPVPTATERSYPFGVDADGVTSPLAIANAHAARTTGEYAFVSNWTVLNADGTLRQRVSMRGRVSDESWRTAIAVAGTSPGILSNRPARGVFWSDGREVVSRRTIDGETRLHHVGADQYDDTGFYARLQRPYPHFPLDGILGGIRLRVRRANDGGVVLVGDAFADPARFARSAWGNDPATVSYRAVVTRDGLVREQRLRYEATYRGERVFIVRQVRYTAVENVTVERPPWYDDAVASG